MFLDVEVLDALSRPSFAAYVGLEASESAISQHLAMREQYVGVLISGIRFYGMLYHSHVGAVRDYYCYLFRPRLVLCFYEVRFSVRHSGYSIQGSFGTLVNVKRQLTA